MEELNLLQNLFNGFTLNTNLLTWALAIGIVTDFITGLAKGYRADKKISSSKLRDGGFKKAGIVLVVILSYGLSVLFSDESHVIFNGVQAYYIYTEMVSIIENLSDMGVDMPKIIKGIIGHGGDDENG